MGSIRFSRPGHSQPATGCGLAIVMAALLLFGGIGSFVAVAMARECSRTLATYSWQPTECQIVASGVTEPDNAGQHAEGYQVEVEEEFVLDVRPRLPAPAPPEMSLPV